MISIFPSEQMGPKPGPSERAAKAAPESQDTSEKSSFASMMAKDDEAPPSKEAVTSKPEAAPAKGETNTRIESPPTEEMLVIAQAETPELEAAAVLTTEDTAPEKALKVEIAVAPTETPDGRKATMVAATDLTSETVDPKIKLTETIGNDRSAIDPDTSVNAKTDLAVSSDAQEDANLKVQPAQVEGETETGRSIPASVEGEETLRFQRNVDAADAPPTEPKDTSARQLADQPISADKQILGADKITNSPVSRDVAMTTAVDPLISVGQTQTTSTQTGPTGLTPTAPAVQVASPNEITSIILNNLKGGVEPREQMIIQLDPPELGRVSIDFKFDAQGVQQITVTAENPEALKRLREMHFELTEALREQGLSDKNMSFQQESREQQDQPSWNGSERAGAMLVASAQPDLSVSAPVLQPALGQTGSDRLDLTL